MTSPQLIFDAIAATAIFFSCISSAFYYSVLKSAITNDYYDYVGLKTDFNQFDKFVKEWMKISSENTSAHDAAISEIHERLDGYYDMLDEASKYGIKERNRQGEE